MVVCSTGCALPDDAQYQKPCDADVACEGDYTCVAGRCLPGAVDAGLAPREAHGVDGGGAPEPGADAGPAPDGGYVDIDCRAQAVAPPCDCFEVTLSGIDHLVCPRAAFHNHDAEARCAAWDGQLAKVDSEHHQALLSYLEQRFDPALFARWTIGLSDDGPLGTDGTFTWPDGTSPTYVPWADGEPHGSDLNLEDCVVIDRQSGGAWRDVLCTDDAPFLCTAPDEG